MCVTLKVASPACWLPTPPGRPPDFWRKQLPRLTPIENRGFSVVKRGFVAFQWLVAKGPDIRPDWIYLKCPEDGDICLQKTFHLSLLCATWLASPQGLFLPPHDFNSAFILQSLDDRCTSETILEILFAVYSRNSNSGCNPMPIYALLSLESSIAFST